MDKHSLDPRGIRREAHGLLTDSWSRAIAVLCLSLMAVTMFMLLNQFVVSLVDSATQYSEETQSAAPQSVSELFEYVGTQKVRLDLTISAVMLLFYFMLISPLNLGVVNWYQSLALCSNLQVGQIFYFYRTNELFLNALLFELARLIRHIVIIAISLMPSALCLGTALNYSADGASAAQSRMVAPLVIGGIALAIVGMIIYAVIVLRWFIAKYLYVGGHGYGVQDCFRYSSKYMKGNIGKVLNIYVSCIPMWLLGIFVITIVFIIPMTKATLAAAAQDIIDENMSPNE